MPNAWYLIEKQFRSLPLDRRDGASPWRLFYYIPPGIDATGFLHLTRQKQDMCGRLNQQSFKNMLVPPLWISSSPLAMVLMLMVRMKKLEKFMAEKSARESRERCARLLFRTETWTANNVQEKKLDVAEMRMLRWMCDVTKMDRIRNERIREKTKVGDVVLWLSTPLNHCIGLTPLSHCT